MVNGESSSLCRKAILGPGTIATDDIFDSRETCMEKIGGGFDRSTTALAANNDVIGLSEMGGDLFQEVGVL